VRAVVAKLLLGALIAIASGQSAASADFHVQNGASLPHAVADKQSARPSAALPAGTTLETWDPALAAALARLATTPTPSNHRAVAVQYARLKVRDIAHYHFTEALRLDPSDALSYEGRARLWRDFGFPALGLGDAYRARYHAPRSSSVANTLGTLFEAMGRFEDALDWYGRALSMEPGAWFVLNNVCHVQNRMLRSTAIEACEKAAAAAPESAVVANNLAIAYAGVGDFDRARQCLARHGDEASTAYNMGIVYMAARQYEQAVIEFRAAWRANPSLTIAGERLRQANAHRASK
jgi:tetratricopeptide (TPR) repeat protein